MSADAGSTPPPARPSPGRCIALALLVVWAVAVIALGAVGFAVLRGWQPERLREGIEWIVLHGLDHSLRIERLEGSLLDGLTLHGVSIRPADPALEAEVGELAARRLFVRIDASASLRRRALVLAEIGIVQPTVRLEHRDDRGWAIGGWGFAGGSKPDGDDGPPHLPFAILVGSFQVSDVHFRLAHDVRSGLEDVRGRIDLGGTGLRLSGPMDLGWPNEGFVRAQIARAGWRGVDLGAGSLLARVRESRIRIESLDLTGPLGQAALAGEIDFAGPINRLRARTGDLRARLTELDLGALVQREAAPDARAWSRLSGELDVQLQDRADEDGSGFELELGAALGPSRLFGGRVEGADLALTYRTGLQRWQLHESTVRLPGGHVVVAGHGSGLHAEGLHATADDFDLSAVPPAWVRGVALRGSADVDLSLEGDPSDPRGHLEASAEGLRLDDVGPGRLSIALTSRGGRHFALDALDLQFAEDAGRLSGLHVRALAPAAVALDGDGVAVHGLALEWTGGSMEVDGGFRDGALLPSHARIDSLDLAVAARVLAWEDEPGGVVSGSLDASGPFTSPDVRADLDWQSPRYRGLRAEHIDLAVDSTTDTYAIEAHLREARREQLRVAATLPRPLDGRRPRAWITDERVALDLEAHALDLGWLAPLLEVAKLRPAGVVDGAITLAGDPSGPTASGALRLGAVRVDPLSESRPETTEAPAAPEAIVGPVTGEVRFDGRSARTEALQYGEGSTALLLDSDVAWSGPRARNVDWRATVTGVGFSGRAIVDLSLRDDHFEPTVVTFSDFDVAQLAARAGLRGRLDGTLTGEFVVRGPTAFPHFRTRLQWKEPRVAGVRADRLVVEARSDAERVTVFGGLDRSGRRVVEATGLIALDRRDDLGGWLTQLRRGPSQPATRLDVDLDDFPLDWLPILRPGIPLETDGLIEGHVTLRGGDPLPSLSGELTLDRGVFSLATQTASVGPLSGTIVLDGQEARFERLVLASKRGDADLSGRVHWASAGIDDVLVRATFSDYRFDQLGLLQTTVEGSVTASGALQALHIEGTLALGNIRISFPSEENPVLKEIRVYNLPEGEDGASIREGGQIAGVQEQSTVDVTFALPPGTWVRGIGLDAEIIGSVHVTKAAGEPLHYAGRLEVEHGRYALQGKRFELDRGVAVFTGGPSAIPEMDIEAHRKASRDVTIYAHVTGPANRPSLRLTSEPPMDTAEIISYMFFGRSTTAGNRESRGLGVSAASMAGSLLLDSVAPELRDTLRIDEISVTSDEDGAPAVEVETQVTPDVYLRLVQSLGASADEAVEVRWRFWRDFNLKSRVSRSGISAIDLLWVFDYWGLEDYGLDGLRAPPPPYRAESKAREDCRPPLACPAP